MYYSIIKTKSGAHETSVLPRKLDRIIMLELLNIEIQLQSIKDIYAKNSRKTVLKRGRASRIIQHVCEAVYRFRNNKNGSNHSIPQVLASGLLQAEAGIE